MDAAFVGALKVGSSTVLGDQVRSQFCKHATKSVTGVASRRATIAMAAVDKSKIPLNLYRPSAPYEATVLYNNVIVGKDAPGDTRHVIFQHDGNVPYLEGQSIGVVAPGTDAKGKNHKARLYSIASTQHGDFGDDKTVSLCVKRLVYENEKGEEVKGVCSNHICDLKPGDKVMLTGPVGTGMLMPADPNATIIMLGTGTGIAPFRGFIRRAFAEQNPDYNFTGKMWLFLGVPTSSSLLYQEEFEEFAYKYPDNFKIDWCISREQKDKEGNKMYIQNRMAEYAEELYNLFQKENTYVYMCGLKGMEPGIDDIMTTLFEKDGLVWKDYRRQMKKAKRWEVETY